MSAHGGPNTTKDGLAFAYDMGNTQKSQKGAATANLYADGDFSSAALHPVRSGTWQIVSDPRNADKKVLKATPSANNQYHGRDITVILSSVYSLQMEVYVSADFNGTSVQMYPEQGGSGASRSYNLSNKNTWQLLRFDGKAATTTNIRMLAYILSAFTSGYVLISNVQVELSAFATPFINGTRSNTQALLDLTNGATVTASSLTYAADNTFRFNGTNYITIPNVELGRGNIPWTINAWIKTTTAVVGLGAGPVLSNASGGPVSSMMGVNSGKIVYWAYQSNAWAQKLGVGKTVNDDIWHMLTWVNYNNYTMDMYVDGVLDSNVANSTSGNSGNPVDRIGGSWSNQFIGSISSLSRYTKALTAEEIQRNFNANRSRFNI